MSQPDPEGPDQGSLGTPGGVDVGVARTALADVGSGALDDAKRAAVGAGDRLRTELNARSTDAGDRLVRVADDLGAVADGLAERGSAQPAKLAAEAAQQSRWLGAYLKDSDTERLIADAEDLMRRGAGRRRRRCGPRRLCRRPVSQGVRPPALRAAGRPGRRSDLGRSRDPAWQLFEPAGSAPGAGAGAAQAGEQR